VADTIVSLIPAEAGWRAVYLGDDETRELTRIVAWALVDRADGVRTVEGMVVDWGDPTQLVFAPDGGSLSAPRFDRYGYKES
jgi:hypothetical protein